MPPTPPPVLTQQLPSHKDIFQVDVLGRMRGQQVQNTYYLQSHAPENNTPGQEPNLQHIAEQIQGIWRAFFLPAAPEDYSVFKYRARNIVGRVETLPGKYRDLYGTTYEEVGTPADVGQAPGPPMPTYTSPSVTLRTALTGKRWVGSRRMPPMLESQVEDDKIVAGALAIFRPIYTQLWVVEVSLNVTPVISSSAHYSRAYADAFPNQEPWTWCLPVLTATLQEVYSHQTTRRLPFIEPTA